MSAQTTYSVIDRQTGQVVKTYTNRATAYRRADKLDLAYGAVRYVVQINWATQPTTVVPSSRYALRYGGRT